MQINLYFLQKNGRNDIFFAFLGSLNRETGLACCNFAGGNAKDFKISHKSGINRT